jgi:hypothetical protein
MHLFFDVLDLAIAHWDDAVAEALARTWCVGAALDAPCG